MHAFTTTADPVTAACGVAGHALLEVKLTDIAAVRELPVPAGITPLPARFLRHADEQTVVGLRAVLESVAACRAAGTSDAESDFADYGVVSAPCQPGRIPAAHCLNLLRSDGPSTVSPHIVPQCSLHSIAGAVSVALGMHGPNVGVSGGPHALSEGLMASMTLLSTGAAPGIWFVATTWDCEPTLDADGAPVERAFDPPICVAFAVALTAATAPAASRLVLRIAPLSPPPRQPRLVRSPADDVRRFAQAIEAAAVDGEASNRWSHAMPWAGELRIARVPATPRLKEAA